MSVYVDALRDWGWKLGPSCHLMADSADELHAFAARLGLKRAWFQASTSGPHYDLTTSKRKLAVELGAKEWSDREMVAHMNHWTVWALAKVGAETTEEGKARARREIFEKWDFSA